MANNLTGDFDVVMEFATLAVNRVLAAMHCTERFPHSMSLRVDDNPRSGRGAMGCVDTFGDPIANQDHIRPGRILPGQPVASDLIVASLDLIVNPDQISADVLTIAPSHLQGRVQLQLGPPTIDVTGATGSNVTVRLPLRARYFPDPQTSPLAEFVRGELQITAPVDQVASPDPQNVRAVLIDIRKDSVSVNLSLSWWSRALTVEDFAGINLLIRNALKTSFLPSSNRLPDNVNFLQFKTLHGPPTAIAGLLNLNTPRGNSSTMNRVFLDLAAGDDFAIALGRDFVLGTFAPVTNKMLTTPIPPISVDVPIWGHADYTVSLNTVGADLLDEKIRMTVTGHAHTSKRRFPDFDFTARLDFMLQANGDSAALIPGSVSVNTTSTLVNTFAKGRVEQGVRDARDDALTREDPPGSGMNAYRRVRDMLSADKNLGQLLRSLLTPPHPQPGVPPLQDVFFLLWYNSVHIESSGIVLHGSLAVGNWPPAHVEFEQIPANTGGVMPPVVVDEGPDYSALKTWIPGGRIEQFEWGHQGQPGYVDVNKFVLRHSPPEATIDGESSAAAVPAFTPLCLTVRGKRYSSSGPVVEQDVSATACGTTRFDVVHVVEAALAGASLRVALTRPGPRGLVEVAGYTPARSDGAGAPTPNRIVHFADDRTSGSLEFLPQALRESGRDDAPAAVLAVLTPDQLPKARHVAGVTYADDQAGAWERAFAVKIARRPSTLVVGPTGNVLWQHEGDVDVATLAAALRRVLAPGKPVALRLSGTNLKIGRRAPNFFVPGLGLSLRKLSGRPLTLVFWNSSSKPSIEAVRDLQKPATKGTGQPPLVLAINDGDAPDLAKRLAADNRLSATLVADPQRSIALAYGVNIWPTIVTIDALGLVRELRYGRVGEAHAGKESAE